MVNFRSLSFGVVNSWVVDCQTFIFVVFVSELLILRCSFWDVNFLGLILGSLILEALILTSLILRLLMF